MKMYLSHDVIFAVRPQQHPHVTIGPCSFFILLKDRLLALLHCVLLGVKLIEHQVHR